MIDELKAKIQGFAAAYKAIKTGAPVAASTTISGSVGQGGKNIAADVKLVQELLNKNHGQSLTADGDCGARTIAAIKDFQAKKLGLANPDGRIDAGGKTWTALSTGKAVAADTTKDGKPTMPAKEEAAPSGKHNSSASAGGGGSTELPEDSTAPVGATAPVSGAISQSVGEGGKNVEADVKLVQQLLNKNHGQSLTADGDCGARTIAAIKDFQAKKVGLANPDGRIDPGGKTWIALSTGKFVAPVPPINNGQNNVQPGDLKGEYAKIAAQYGVEQAVVYTIQKVESGGKGYLADGRAKILFEGHVFWRELVAIGKDPKALVEGNENILYPKWVSTHYVGGAGEYDRLAKAQKIDSSAALKSASWGEFQIMGNNHKSVGYSTVEAFVEAMKVPGTNNIKALMEFCKNNKLLRFVTGPNKKWAKFAEGYNGPAYKKNKYDEKLAAAYAEFKKQYPEPTPPMA